MLQVARLGISASETMKTITVLLLLKPLPFHHFHVHLHSNPYLVLLDLDRPHIGEPSKTKLI